ncbi:MAG TPA: hypothetical protein DDX29_01440 [Clostridiales bacterium]|nr:hypothetical protein [Clostridiales bacterium]
MLFVDKSLFIRYHISVTIVLLSIIYKDTDWKSSLNKVFRDMVLGWKTINGLEVKIIHESDIRKE